MVNVFFLHQIKRTNGAYDKGIVVKNLERQEGETDDVLSNRNYEAALQGYHAYLGAYGYAHDPQTDFVSCEITDLSGSSLISETWNKPTAEPEQQGE